MTLRFNKDQVESGRKAVRKHLKSNNKLPANVTIKSQDGVSRKLSKAQFAGICEADNLFRIKHGRAPNYVTLVSSASNPLVLNYQDNDYNCCPASFNMATQMLYGFSSESACAKALGTTRNGTSPSALVKNSKKLGYKATAIRRNYNAVKDSLAKNRPVIAHIQTYPARSCLNYVNDYGHYILIWKVQDNKYYICDPTKGDKVCKSTIIDKATNGRDIKYYSISLL